MASRNRVCETLACAHPTLEKLLAAVDIPEFGDERTEAERTRVTSGVGADKPIRIDDAIRCKRDLWDAICRAGWVIDGDEGIKRYRKVRTILVPKATDHPREAALAALALEGPDATKHAIFRRLGGTFVSIGPVMEVIDRELGRPVRETSRTLLARELPVAEFLARYALFAGLEGTCEDREFEGSECPSPALLGRVELMRSPDLEALTGLFLMVAPGRIAESSTRNVLLMLEALDVAADAGVAALGDGLMARFHAVVIEDALQLSPSQRNKMVQRYTSMRTMMRDWADELPAERRAVFERLVPPPLPATYADALEAVEDVAEREKGDRRGETAAPISQRRERFLNVAELRFRQTDRLVDKIVADLRRVQAGFAAGRRIALPITVNDTYHVVRPEAGGMGDGSQTISVRIETAADLWMQCARADIAAGTQPHQSGAWGWLDAGRRQVLHPRDDGQPPHVDGDGWDPGLETELKVVYVATRPARPGGERVEPYWTVLYRSRLFDADKHITPAERDERKALVDALGFDPMKAPCPGLFADTSRRGQALTRAYRRLVSRERFILPAEDLRYSMAVGRVVMRPELMRGMRIGESSQARADEGAFDFRKFDGKIYYYLSAVPKMHDRPRRLVLDEVTVTAFERLRVIAVERWFRDEGDIPVREYQWKEKKLPPARYLLGNETRALIYAEMNLSLRILTLGVIGSSSHSYKYGFAAMMKRGEAPDPILRRSLNHKTDSQVSDPYARFFTEVAIDPFIAEQQRESAKLELDYALLDR